MSYPVISARRIPYDIDGSAVGWCDGVVGNGPVNWVTGQTLTDFNSEKLNNNITVYGSHPDLSFWMFFHELKEIEAIGFSYSLNCEGLTSITMQGSTDSGNGLDGTWETAALNFGGFNKTADNWRARIIPVSFSGPKKVIRVTTYISGIAVNLGFSNCHIYGRKAAGQTVDDIIFANSVGEELTSLKDWGDRPEGTTIIEPVFYLKNVSPTKIANDVNLQLNHENFVISLSPDGPWVATIDISSIAPGSLSAPIYIKNYLGAPPLTLGPKAARVIATINSWA